MKQAGLLVKLTLMQSDYAQHHNPSLANLVLVWQKEGHKKITLAGWSLASGGLHRNRRCHSNFVPPFITSRYVLEKILETGRCQLYDVEILAKKQQVSFT